MKIDNAGQKNIARSMGQQVDAARRAYGEKAPLIEKSVMDLARRYVEGLPGGNWDFYSVGDAGYWAPAGDGRYSVTCIGAMTTLEAVDAQTLGIAYTIVAMSLASYDAYMAGNEDFCEQLAEWQRVMSDYVSDSKHLDRSIIRTLLD